MNSNLIDNLECSIIANIGITDNNFSLVKHYNSLILGDDDILAISSSNPNLKIVDHYFNVSHMICSYEPFLQVIKELFLTDFSISIDSFLEICDVYSQHKSILKSFIESGKCIRFEDILLDEVEYEQTKMVTSIAQMLIVVSNVQPILFILEGIQLASSASLQLMLELANTPNNKNIGIIGIYNESLSPFPHGEKIWNELLSYYADLGSIIESQITNISGSFDISQDFIFTTHNLDDYLAKLNNMLLLLDLNQAKYYLEIIYKIINVEELTIPANIKLEILSNYATVSIYTDNMSHALLLCENIRELSNSLGDKLSLYHCNYLLGLTNMYNGKLDFASKHAKKCHSIASEINNELLIFKAELLELMAKLSGFHNIFFCAEDVYVEEAFIEKCKKYGYINHLSHIYIYAFDNNPSFFISEQNVKEKLKHFNSGIHYIEQLGNEYFLLKAYRNNIMIASTGGYFKTANYYYHICYSIVKNKNPFEEANVYNGLGYNSCAMEDYVGANEYYNKAIKIFQELGMIDYVGETLYNMSINCIMAEDYQRAYDYLTTCLKIIKELKLNSLRVCNISKLFGLLALCSFHLEKMYSCSFYLNSSQQFLSHLIDKNHKDNIHMVIHDYTLCDDDLFMFYFVSSLVFIRNNLYHEALDYLNTASQYIEHSAGNQFFTYAQYSIEKSKLHRNLGQDVLAKEELNKCLKFYENIECFHKAHMLKSTLLGKNITPYLYDLDLQSLTMNDILLSLKQAALIKENKEQKKQLDFLSTWQKLIDINGKTKFMLVDTSIQAFSNRFNIDKIMFIQYENENPKVLYDNTDIPFNTTLQTTLKEYFKRKRLGFVASKINANYNDYTQIISLFDKENVCSLIGIPFFVNDTLHGLLIAYILMKDNWHSPINKYMLDQSDLKISEFVFRQLLASIESFDANDKINQMNHKLHKSSVTDHLTGLLNREGFYKNLSTMLESALCENQPLAISIMYIDLDNFKYYNDTFGHNIGDLLLKKMSQTFVKVCDSNGFVTRYGGDEFIILLNTNDKLVATEVAQNIYWEIEQADAFESSICEMIGSSLSIDTAHRITCSMGIAASNSVFNEDDLTKLIKQADSMLFDIKRNSKGTYRFITT